MLGIPRTSPKRAGVAALSASPTAGCELTSAQVLAVSAIQEKQLRRTPGSGGGQSEERKKSRALGQSRVRAGLQSHTAGCPGSKMSGRNFPLLKKSSPLHLIAASNKQFFQISSDLRSSECVELKKHQDHNYGYYRVAVRLSPQHLAVITCLMECKMIHGS